MGRPRIYNLNEDYFSQLNCPEKVYYLGYLYADGCVTDYALIWRQARKNRQILEDFAKDIKYDGNIKDKEEVKDFGKGQKVYQSSHLDLCSKKLVGDLAKWGVVANKTFRLQLPIIDKALNKDFIRGYFDGDGGVSKTKNNGYGKQKFRWVLSIVGQEDFLNHIHEIICHECQIELPPVKRKTRSSRIENCWEVRCGHHGNLPIIRDWLYSDAPRYLKWKHDLFQQFPN